MRSQPVKLAQFEICGVMMEMEMNMMIDEDEDDECFGCLLKVLSQHPVRNASRSGLLTRSGEVIPQSCSSRKKRVHVGVKLRTCYVVRV